MYVCIIYICVCVCVYIYNSMKHSRSWETNGHSANQEMPRLLWNPQVHYRVHKSLPKVPILSQMDSLHSFVTYFFKINFNIILPFTYRYPKLYEYDMCKENNFTSFMCTLTFSPLLWGEDINCKYIRPNSWGKYLDKRERERKMKFTINGSRYEYVPRNLVVQIVHYR
jgi:hypothetical protein